MRLLAPLLLLTSLTCTARVGYDRPSAAEPTDPAGDHGSAGGDASIPGDPPTCTHNDDCDDDDPCTTDSCAGACVYSIADNGTSCDDGDDCTTDDQCTTGTCGGTLLDRDRDGHVASSCGGDDCDDDDETVHGGATEGPVGDPVCSDGVDNDCDNRQDALDPGCNHVTFTQVSMAGEPTWHLLEENALGIDDTFFFVASEPVFGLELWSTDGLTATMVRDIHPAGDSRPTRFRNLNGRLCFFATDDTHGRELWCSDGTTAGTGMVMDINPTGDAIGYSQPAMVGSRLVFMADDSNHGTEPWISDGTPGGTSLLLDINPGVDGSDPVEMITLDATTVIFEATDPIHGVEVWRTDGTPSGTALVHDTNPGVDNSLSGGWWRYFYVFENEIYYRSNDGTNGLELWKTDGTAGGTSLVADVDTSPTIGGCYSTSWKGHALGLLFFHADNGTSGYEMHVSDGTAAGTRLLIDLLPGDSSASSGTLHFTTEYAGHAYFAGNDATGSGWELFQSDGTTAGTAVLKDIHPTGDGDPGWMFLTKGELYFTADDGVHGFELWKTDGSASGTVLAHEFNSTGSSWPYCIGTLGDAPVLWPTGESGDELWIME